MYELKKNNHNVSEQQIKVKLIVLAGNIKQRAKKQLP